MTLSAGVLAQAIQTIYASQVHLLVLPGTTQVIPITQGVTQIRVWGIAPGGPGGNSGAGLGGAGGGSSGEGVGGAAGRVYSLPLGTVAVETFNGLLGVPGVSDSAASTLKAVLSDTSRVLLQSLRGGLRGITATTVNGANGAASPNGEFAGGLGSSSTTARGTNGNSVGAMATYITANALIPGSSGGGGGRMLADRSGGVDAGRGGQGGAYTIESGIANKGANNFAGAGAGGNSPAYAWADGRDGQSYDYNGSNAYSPIPVTKKGCGGAGGITGQKGLKGGLGYWRIEEIAGTNPPGAWQGAERLYSGAKTFPAAFIRCIESGWPGPAGGYGTSYTAPTYAAHIGGLRTFGWEDAAGVPATGSPYGCGGPWPSIMANPASPQWAWWDQRMAAAQALGYKLTVGFYGTPTAYSTNTAAVDAFGTFGGNYPPTSYVDLYNFVVLFLTRYGYGAIDRIECWNEPSFGFFKGTASQLVDVHRTIQLAAKAVDTRFIIISAGWLGSSDLTGVRQFLTAYGTYYPAIQGWQTFESYGAHPYDTAPDESAGSATTAGEAMLSSNKSCILYAWEEVLSNGGTWGGFDVTEFGASETMPGMANDGVRGLYVAGMLLASFAAGANTFSFFQTKSGVNTSNGQKWLGATGEAVLAKVAAFFKVNICGKSLVSIKEQRGGASGTSIWRITRSDGATFLINSATFA